MLTDQNRILFSETCRCARQQRWALLLFLLLSLLHYCLYTRGSWIAPVPTVRSLKIFFSRVVLGSLLSLLLITTPWLLLTQTNLQHRAITLPHLIRRSVRLFPKLVAVHVITWLPMMILAFIGLTFSVGLWGVLLGILVMIKGLSNLSEFLIQQLISPLWLYGTLLLLPMLLSWYSQCRLLFTAYIVVTEPRATLLSTLGLSWRWSRSCLSHLFFTTLLLGLLSLGPSIGLQFSSLRTNPWVNIGVFLYCSALGLLSSIYFFVLYQQRSTLPEQSVNLSED